MTMSDAATTTTTDTTSEGSGLRGHDLGDRWAVSLYVPPALLRTLKGEQIVGIEDNPNQAGRVRPKYDRAANGFLQKAFIVYVPKAEGTYDLTASFPEGERSLFESCQVKVTKHEDGSHTIAKIGFGEMVESFGGERLVAAKATASDMIG